MSSSELPKVIGKLENVTVNEGNEAKFVVKFAGKPKPNVKWFKEEEEIVTTIEETYEVIETEDTVQFIIKSVKPENSGNYFAQLTNEAGSINSNKAQLLVNSELFIINMKTSIFLKCKISGAPIFVKLPDTVGPVTKDESVKYESIIEGLPKPTISWLLNGKELSNKDGVVIEKDVNTNKYSLSIPKVNPNIHSGKISIIAKNTIGTIQHEILLSVNGKFKISLNKFHYYLTIEGNYST